MTTNHIFVSLSLFTFLTALPLGAATAGEKEIAKKDLPAPVLAAFEKAYPHATIKETAKEVKDGKTLYEIESLDGTTSRDVTYLADGKTVEIEETVAAAELPDAVKATVSKEYPKGKISKAEKVTHGEALEYEIHVVVPKVKHELVVDPSGKVLKH